MNFHLGYLFLIASATADSVGGFLLTCTETLVVEVGVPPVEEYLIFTLTDGMQTLLEIPACTAGRASKCGSSASGCPLAANLA